MYLDFYQYLITFFGPTLSYMDSRKLLIDADRSSTHIDRVPVQSLTRELEVSIDDH